MMPGRGDMGDAMPDYGSTIGWMIIAGIHQDTHATECMKLLTASQS